LRSKAVDREVLQRSVRVKEEENDESDGASTVHEFAVSDSEGASGMEGAASRPKEEPIALLPGWRVERVKRKNREFREFVDPSGRRYQKVSQAAHAINAARTAQNVAQKLRAKYASALATDGRLAKPKQEGEREVKQDAKHEIKQEMKQEVEHDSTLAATFEAMREEQTTKMKDEADASELRRMFRSGERSEEPRGVANGGTPRHRSAEQSGSSVKTATAPSSPCDRSRSPLRVTPSSRRLPRDLYAAGGLCQAPSGEKRKAFSADEGAPIGGMFVAEKGAALDAPMN